MAMKLSNVITALFLGSVIAGAVLLAMDAIAPKTSLARDRGTPVESGVGGPGDQGQRCLPNVPSPCDETNDSQRVPVQLWTVLAAVGAAGVGLVFFLVRVALGRVKLPPPQEEAHH